MYALFNFDKLFKSQRNESDVVLSALCAQKQCVVLISVRVVPLVASALNDMKGACILLTPRID